MKLKLLITTLIVAVMSAAAPVWAHGGHDRGYGHAHGHWKKHHRHFHHHGHGYYRDRVVVRVYVHPVPVYRSYYSAPAPGVHIVLPDIYIPLR